MFFQQRTIRQKLSLVVISSSLVVLILLGVFIGLTEFVSIRENLAQEQQTLAEVLGSQLAGPLLDRDLNAVKEILSALNSDRRIRAAYLFDSDNLPFAQYLDVRATRFVEKVLSAEFEGGKLPIAWQQPLGLSHYGVDHLTLYIPVTFQDLQIGSLYLLSDLHEFNHKLLGLLLMLLVVGGVGVGLSWGVSGRLSRPVSQPLLDLAGTMLRISESGHYSLRAEKQSEDEIGQLVDGFNDMLTQIEIRDRKLEGHQRYLAETVRERTAQLSQTVRDLAEAKKQSDAANQAKSVFLANVTHELRTPLIGVLGMNELLLESRLDKQQQALAETVQRSGQDLLNLINEILDFSRLEGGELDLQTERFSLRKLIEEVIANQAPKAFAKDLELICYLSPDAARMVDVDVLRLRQILNLLLDNAIKFTSQGHVRLQVSLCDSGETLFEVSDTGIGIDEESQNDIFEAFLQVDNSSTRLFGGTGLGLSVVRELTVLMEGRVGLESRPGVGSTFSVSLPLKGLEADFPQVAQDKLSSSVLVFCPSELLRENLVRILLDLGFSAMPVADRDELFQRLKNADLHARGYAMVFLADASGAEVASELSEQVRQYSERVVCLCRQVPASPPPQVRSFSLPLLWSWFETDLFVPASEERPTSERISVSGAPSVEKREPSPPQPAAEEFAQLLVVDDNPSTRELIGFSLVDSGWSVTEAASAAEALRCIAARDFDLILMDINMPGQSGLDAVRDLRAQDLTTPIYALTAHGDEAVFAECLDSGMQGVLRKPFRQNELFELLNRIRFANDRESGEAKETGR